MKTVNTSDFYAFVATIKKVTERKPHFKKVVGGIELHYIVSTKGVKSTVAVARNVNSVHTYKIA